MSKEQNNPLSEQDTQPLDLDFFIDKTRTKTPPYKQKPPEVVAERLRLTHMLQSRLAFPVETEPMVEDAVEIASEMREAGYSFIVPYSHADKRGPVDVMTTLLSMGKGFEDAEYLGPLALHQDKGYIQYLSKHADIPLARLVTPATIEYYEKKKNKKPSPLKRASDIFRQGEETEVPQLNAKKGLFEYNERAGKVLAEDKGIVFAAPQGGRRPTLGQPAGRAVEMLIRSGEKKGADKIAVWPMGILLKNESTSPGLNPFRKVRVAFNEPLTVEQLREEAKATGLTLDQQIFEEFKTILPPSYVFTTPLEETK